MLALAMTAPPTPVTLVLVRPFQLEEPQPVLPVPGAQLASPPQDPAQHAKPVSALTVVPTPALLVPLEPSPLEELPPVPPVLDVLPV